MGGIDFWRDLFESLGTSYSAREKAEFGLAYLK